MHHFNKLNIPNVYKMRQRMELCLDITYSIYKDTNINHYKNYKDLDMEIYGIWLDAINICALRSMDIPAEILDDFYYEHKEEE